MIPGRCCNNIDKRDSCIQPYKNRKARFRTIISLIQNGEEYKFEGICEGMIVEKPKGNNGFGYDPVFVPVGSDRTFAEMTTEEKNLFSHRRKAMEKLIEFLEPQ